MADLRHKLDKETRKRHFPEMDGGKGSKPRRAAEETRKAYAEGWDRIFKKWLVAGWLAVLIVGPATFANHFGIKPGAILLGLNITSASDTKGD